jgi:hypothetical protein
MRHSFILPRPKKLISWELKVLLIFFSVIMGLLIATYIYLKIEIYVFDEEANNAKVTTISLNNARKKMQERIDYIKIEANRAKLIYTDNKLLSESIKNLFDIIPDKITLSKAILGKSSLVLYGKTPSKEVYQFRLLAPLRSIFDRSYTSYYQKRNGWINFVSTNYIDAVDKVNTKKGKTDE